jgi:hypothetical protein
MKKILFLSAFFVVLLNLNSCNNQEAAKKGTTPSQVSPIKSNQNITPKIDDDEDSNDSCEKRAVVLKNISFLNEIQKVQLGFYKTEVTRSRAFASEEDIGGEIDTERFAKIVPLEKNTLEKLYAILLGYTKGELDMAHCYEPRHYIWFEDSEGRIVSYIEICFQCHQIRQPKGGIEIECNEQLDKLNEFVRSLK